MPTQRKLRMPPANDAAGMPALFEIHRFDLGDVTGLSKHALEIHLALYEGYVKEANTLQPLIHSVQARVEQNGKKSQAAPANVEQTAIDRLLLDGLVRRFAFERNGVVLHELFFEALHGPSALPSGAFANAARKSYGSFAAWKSHATQLGQTRGIGWVLAVQAPDNSLTNIWIDDHTDGLPVDSTPVLALDLWEHAYLLDFKPSQRAQYLTTLLDNIDWAVIDARCH